MNNVRLWHFVAFALVGALIHQVVRHGVNSLWHLF